MSGARGIYAFVEASRRRKRRYVSAFGEKSPSKRQTVQRGAEIGHRPAGFNVPPGRKILGGYQDADRAPFHAKPKVARLLLSNGAGCYEKKYSFFL